MDESGGRNPVKLAAIARGNYDGFLEEASLAELGGRTARLLRRKNNALPQFQRRSAVIAAYDRDPDLTRSV